MAAEKAVWEGRPLRGAPAEELRLPGNSLRKEIECRCRPLTAPLLDVSRETEKYHHWPPSLFGGRQARCTPWPHSMSHTLIQNFLSCAVIREQRVLSEPCVNTVLHGPMREARPWHRLSCTKCGRRCAPGNPHGSSQRGFVCVSSC